MYEFTKCFLLKCVLSSLYKKYRLDNFISEQKVLGVLYTQPFVPKKN